MNNVWMLILLINVTVYANLTLEDSEHFTLDRDENISISGNIHITKDTTFTAMGYSDIYVQKDWINEGFFEASHSSVYLTGVEPSFIKGDTTFYNFIAQKDLTFDSNKTQSITHTFRISDAAINASLSGVYAIINLALVDIIDVENLIIQDSKVIGRASALNPPSSRDDGHNLYWFSLDDTCTNIGSGSIWFDKLNCQPEEVTKNDYTSYIIKNSNNTISKISLDEDTDIVVTPIANETNDKQSLLFTYKAPINAQHSCQRDMQIVLEETGHINTGFIGCGKDDPTLENENDFEIATNVFITKIAKNETSRLIVIDVNLSSKDVIIGGVDAD